MPDDNKIETPEDMTRRWWLDMEATHKYGGVEPTNIPVSEPHPNEVATRQAVEGGIYSAEDVGVVNA